MSISSCCALYLAPHPGDNYMIGYYVFTGLIYLPIFERQMQANALRELLEEVSARLRPYFGSSLLIFIVTGTHLMIINEGYLGLGNFFGNALERFDRDQTRDRVGLPRPGHFLRASYHGQDQRQGTAALKQFRRRWV